MQYNFGSSSSRRNPIKKPQRSHRRRRSVSSPLMQQEPSDNRAGAPLSALSQLYTLMNQTLLHSYDPPGHTLLGQQSFPSYRGPVQPPMCCPAEPARRGINPLRRNHKARPSLRAFKSASAIPSINLLKNTGGTVEALWGNQGASPMATGPTTPPGTTAKYDIMVQCRKGTSR